MSIMGIGPKLFLTTMLYSFLLVLFTNHFKYKFAISFIHYRLLVVLGILLIMIGIPLLVTSVIEIKEVYKADSLCVKGVYSVCRHPLYSSWIILIVPGITLLLNSWILLSIPLIMYLAFRILIKQEETFLQNKFGTDYLDYKNKVGLLFPKFWKYESKNE